MQSHANNGSSASAVGASGVRLDEVELEGLCAAFDEMLPELGAISVHLFGSRTTPTSRGGDIDLLVTPAEPLPRPLAIARTLRIALFDRIGEQKIDIVFDHPGAEGALRALARRQGVLLWRRDDTA